MSSAINKISLIIGTAGHIDHGKTSLIKALTSIETDRLTEEKRRGLTIDLGFAYLDIPHKGMSYRAAIVDVPGHERFIKNMLAGATGIDLVLFTVAADDGVMPQTTEHLDIISLLGIRDVFFIITKIDLVDAKRLEEVKAEIDALIADTPLKGSPFFTLSVKTGAGLEALTEALGEKVLAMKDEKCRRGERSYFRMPIDRSFTIKGFGTVVTGTVAGGSADKGSSLIAYPSGQSLKARGLESMHITAQKVSAGERAAINLSAVSCKELKRGTCLIAPELSPYVTMAPVIDCDFEFIAKKNALKKSSLLFKDRGLIKVFHHTGETLARIRFAGIKQVKPGERVTGRLFLRRPLLMMHGDAFILRDPSLNITVGGGSVIFSYSDKNLVPRLSRFAKRRVDVDNKRGEGEVFFNRLAFLTSERRPGFTIKTLSLLLNIREDLTEAFIAERLSRQSPFYLNGGFLISREYDAALSASLTSLLGSYHEKNPLKEGISDEDLLGLYITSLRTKSAEGMRPLYRLLLEEMVSEGAIERKGPCLCCKGFSSSLNAAEIEILSHIRRILKAAGLGLIKTDELQLPDYPAREIDTIIAYMKNKGDIVSLKKDSFIDGEALNSARERIISFITDNGPIRAAECRDILGCGRKLAILILEYLDGQGVTQRSGDERTLR